MNISPASSSFRPLNADFNLAKPQFQNKEAPKSNIEKSPNPPPLTILDPDDIDAGASLESKPTVSIETVKEYLEAVAIADSAKSSVSDIGYIVTGATLATVAFLAFRNLSLERETIQLKDSLFACKNNAHDPNAFKALDWVTLRPNPSGQFFGTATKIIDDFFKKAPKATSPQDCRFTPLVINSQNFGLQKRCIQKEPLEFNADGLAQGLTFTASPYISTVNSTNPGYQALTFICKETLNFAAHHVTFNSKCTGTLQSYVHTSASGTDPVFDGSSKMHSFYLAKEKPNRIVLIDASLPAQAVIEQCWQAIEKRLLVRT